METQSNHPQELAQIEEKANLINLIDEELLHLGSKITDESDEETEVVQLKPKTLLRHLMALGSSGSGKTVLSKVVVEEMTRLGLPALCIDPQGDLCSLALALQSGDDEILAAKGVSTELAAQFREQVEVVVFTPASRKGIPLCADPLNIDISDLGNRERIEAISNMAMMLTSLIGFDLGSDDGEGIRAAFDAYLNILFKQDRFPRDLEQFGEYLQKIDEDHQKELERFVNSRKLDQAMKKLARLDVGSRRLLFHEGLPLNIDLLLGNGEKSGAKADKVRLAVIYLNTLNSSEDKEFLIAAVAEQLYNWMLKNPSKKPQALFYIDEVAPFIPPVKMPACKPSLSLIFKQARKYGVCCLMATQNPGDVDYKAMAQFGTWAIGRLTTKQDLKKIQPTLKSLDPDRADEIVKRLPTLQAGEFMLISPDAFKETIALKTRWLYSEHETLDDRRIETLCDERWRDRFLALEQHVDPNSVEAKTHLPKANDKKQNKTKAKTKNNKTTNITKEKGTEKNTEPQRELKDEILELLDQGDTFNISEVTEKVSAGKAKVSSTLKALVEAGELSQFKDGRSQMYYSPSSGARPDLGLSSKVFALIPKLSQEEISARIEDNRQKSFLGFFGKDETLESKRLIYHVLYQVIFQETVEKSGLSAFFGSSNESVEDSIYLEPKTLKIFVYVPNKSIQLIDSPSQYASEIPDFDGVSDLTELSPGSIEFDEESWSNRQNKETVKKSVNRKFSSIRIQKIRPVLLPVWQLRYQEKGGHQVRIVYIDGLTGQSLDLHV